MAFLPGLRASEDAQRSGRRHDDGPGSVTALFLLGLASAVALYLCCAWLLFPILGLEDDEVLFASAVLRPDRVFAHVSAFHATIPVMLNSYLGAFKSWPYAPIFALFGYGIPSVRIPMIILAALTVALVGLLLREISSPRAGLFAAWMLATDATFLLTETFDWGPVVIQNFLLTAGLFGLVGWSKRGGDWRLLLSGLAFGVALWDKALFVWDLSGMAVAFLALQPRFLIDKARRRGAALAILGVLIGGLPLIAYNVVHRGSTLRGNAHLSVHQVASKLDYLGYAVDGWASALAFSDFKYPASDGISRPFAVISRRVDSKVPWLFSSWRRWLFPVLLLLGLLCAKPPRRKWILFFLGSAALSWVQSALTIGAGNSIHHSVLIWPLLFCGMALCADAVAGRMGGWGTPALAAVTILFSLRGLLMINHAYASMLAFSPVVRFSNADTALVSYLEQIGAHRIVTVDWGIADPATVRSKGEIDVIEDAYMLRDHDPIAQDLLACHADPACVLVTHPDARQVFPSVNESVRTQLAEMHRRTDLLQVIRDSHGTPTFEVFRVKSAE